MSDEIGLEGVEVVLTRRAMPWWDFPWEGRIPGTDIHVYTCFTRRGALWSLKRKYKALKRDDRRSVTVRRNW